MSLAQKINIHFHEDMSSFVISFMLGNSKEILVKNTMQNRQMSFYINYIEPIVIRLQMLNNDGNEYHVYYDMKNTNGYSHIVDLKLIKHSEIGVFNDVSYSYELKPCS